MTPPPRDDRGSAVAEFALVAVLLVGVALGIAQLGLAIHVRNTLVASAADGARVAANADREPSAGAAHTRELISSSLSPRYSAEVAGDYVDVDGVLMARVRVKATLPLVGLAGPARTIDVAGHAVAEQVP